MYIGVTPILHTIRGVEQFTYLAPHPLSVERGQVVAVPWRTKTILGVVTATSGVAPHPKAKSIVSAYEFILSPSYLRFLMWLRDFYAISLCHALKYALPPLHRKVLLKPLPRIHPQPIVRKPSLRTVVIAQTKDTIAFLRACVRDLKALPCALIVPEEADVVEYKKAFEDIIQPMVVTARAGRQALRSAFATMLAHHQCVYLGTKRLALFPLMELKQIVVLYPEDSAHKQWDLNPRYHVERIAEMFAHEFQIPLTFISYAPRIEQYASHRIDTTLINTTALPTMRFISLEQRHLLSVQVLERLQNAKCAVIWYQRKGKHQLLICHACSTVANVDTSPVCPTCKSANVHLRSFGTTALAEELQRLFPRREVVEITQDSKKRVIPYHKQPIIVGTMAMRHRLEWQHVDYAVIALADQVLGLAHFRAHELAYQQFVWLRNHVPVLDVQTAVPNHPVLMALQDRWPEWWYAKTLRERKQFHYPPAGEYIEIQHTKTKEHRVIHSLNQLPNDSHWIVDREI